MKRRTTLLLSAATIGLLWVEPVMAQSETPTPQGAEDAVSAPQDGDIVVTGSYIRGSAEDAALPVDVIGERELANRGSPTALELVKALPISSGVLGDSNQFDGKSSGAEGSGSINLRGLGGERTLVLLNGRRLAFNPSGVTAGGVVDTNLLPIAAIGRVEVLKDGAAALYGSDAVSGVVNFITRENQRGFKLSADYRFVAGSDGDYNLGASWGQSIGDLKLFLAAGFQRRSELRVTDRDFAYAPYLENPQAGWNNTGNPGAYIPLGANLAANGAVRRDVNCASLGGFPGFSGANAVCYNQSVQFYNLVEEEKRAQFFGQAEYEVSNALRFHVEGLYSLTRVPRVRSAPSVQAVLLPSVEPTGNPALAGRLFVPAYNPGFQSYVAANPNAFPAGTVGVQLANWRAYFSGGNPLYDTAGTETERRYDAYRVSGGISGDVSSDVSYDVTATYMRSKAFRTAPDLLINRLQLALVGLGGPNCDAAPTQPGIQGTPGVGGCQYFNPFSTAIQYNPVSGATNPQYNPAVANTVDMARWLYPEFAWTFRSSLLVVDGVVTGTSLFELPGGDVGWAVGGQFRRDTYRVDVTDLLNPLVTPCRATPDFFVTNCDPRTGPLAFLGQTRPNRLSGNVWAVFGELSLPVFDNLNFQVAARYEDYGGGIGSTFDPKIAGRWQALPWLAVRGSYSTTFRGPPLIYTDPNPSSAISLIRGSYRTIDIVGSPNLKPENATNLNAGLLVETGGFRASVDYWRIHLQNALVTEPVAALVNALYPTAGTNRCGDPAIAAIQSRFVFNDLNGNGTADDCAAINISRLRTNVINGSPIKTDGIDFAVSYEAPEFAGLRTSFGVDATWTRSYKVSALTLDDVPLSPAFDAVGSLNLQTVAYPLPEWRGQAYLNVADDRQNLRLTMRYFDGYTDNRTDIYAPSVNFSTDGTTLVTMPQGKKIESWTVFDLAYRLTLPFGPVFTATVENIFNTDPPFVRQQYSYDPFVANPLGTTVKLGLQVDF